jgi:hypothetical protein
MNNRRRTQNKKIEKKQSQVIRCKKKMMPVFENDACQDILIKEKTSSNNNCKNCRHSF